MLAPLFEKHAKEIPNVSDKERSLLEQHFSLLIEWNEQMSLVSPKSIETAFATHYLDSIHLADFGKKHGPAPFHDFGSGAGFPGLVFAIRYPDIPITLYEKQLKKQTFLMNAVTHLKLPNVRLESLLEGRSNPGLFFARAVIPRDEIFDYFQKRLSPGARLVVTMGGSAPPTVPHKKFLKVAQTTYSLPLDSGNRQAEIYEFVPRGT